MKYQWKLSTSKKHCPDCDEKPNITFTEEDLKRFRAGRCILFYEEKKRD
jgi:hypothetical protein